MEIRAAAFSIGLQARPTRNVADRAVDSRRRFPWARPLGWLILLTVLCGGPLKDLTAPTEILEAESSAPAEEKESTAHETEPLVAGRRTGWQMRRSLIARDSRPAPAAACGGVIGVERQGNPVKLSVGLRVPLRC